MLGGSSLAGGTSALAERLEDPMRDISRRMGTFVWVMFICLLFLSLLIVVLLFVSKNQVGRTLLSGTAYFCWILFFSYLVNLIWWRAFAPRQDTNVFYLRSFQNDPASWPIRVAIQDALGDRVRLSGIRDPRRRVAFWSDGLSPWLKAMRHCTPKFMDLEAESDWKSRLWNSLQSGDMAIIDLTEITPIVLEEINLVAQAIGIERVVFLGTSPEQSELQLLELIEQRIGSGSSRRPHIIMWPNNLKPDERKSWLREFKNNIRALYQRASQLPPIMKQPVPEAYCAPSSSRRTIPMSVLVKPDL
jgi:hypothetical protein